jgi:pimeloyl-ACP methyl ester carboxylesterase
MDIVLIPGFWLDGGSWRDVAAPLAAAGHRIHSLTLPGLESRDADRRDITLRDHVDAVVATLDALDSPALLVGHSGGGAIAWGAVDARPESVARVIYVDSFPLADGHVVNDELPVVDGEVPLPAWSFFPPEDLVDLDDGLRTRFRSIAIPEPARVASDPIHLVDTRRYAVPATVICCEFTAAQLTEWMAGGFAAELPLTRNVELVDLPTGHWPQFTKPHELAETILGIIGRDDARAS